LAIDNFVDPLKHFDVWYKEACESKIKEPSAMSLATVDSTGRPSVRMVLLKGFSDQGFVFYTNLNSRKGKDLQRNQNAALCFHWIPLEKQVRIEGHTVPVSDEEADNYFSSRSRDSQISAWASIQSSPLTNRKELEKRCKDIASRFEGIKVPRPDFWSGYRLRPREIEFWTAGDNRLHERIVYTFSGDTGCWKRGIKYP